MITVTSVLIGVEAFLKDHKWKDVTSEYVLTWLMTAKLASLASLKLPPAENDCPAMPGDCNTFLYVLFQANFCECLLEGSAANHDDEVHAQGLERRLRYAAAAASKKFQSEFTGACTLPTAVLQAVWKILN